MTPKHSREWHVVGVVLVLVAGTHVEILDLPTFGYLQRGSGGGEGLLCAMLDASINKLVHKYCPFG